MDIKDFTVFTVFHIPLSINSKYFFLKLCVSLPVTDKKIRFEIAFEQLPIDLFFQTASLNISLNCLIITTRSGSLISLIYINWHFLFIKFADRRLWIGYLHSGENWFLQFNICNRSITINNNHHSFLIPSIHSTTFHQVHTTLLRSHKKSLLYNIIRIIYIIAENWFIITR